MIQIKDSSTVPFENNIYDTIIFDSPYMTESEFQKFVGKDKKNKVQDITELFLKTPEIEKIEKSVEQYASSNPCWIVYFTNNRFNIKPTKYVFNWMRERGGMGGYIRRNTEYISCVNYFDLKPFNSIDETIFILVNKVRRACEKPVKLYERIYEFLGSKKVLDLFAGWGNSVVAAYNLGLEIDAYDIDFSLQERFSKINSMGKKKQLTLREVI